MVKFLDLQKITESFEPELSQTINKVVRKGWYLLGEETIAFEKEYADFIGSKHCISVANGLDALRLILKAYIELGAMNEGDEIIVPANTYIASILAITDNRLKPVLVEPDINTYNLDIKLIEQHVTSRTRGIMVVHLYGHACWSDELDSIAKKYDLKIIEDNAQAAGARIHDTCHLIGGNNSFKSRRTGSLGHAAGHSFYPGKNFGALGDGGAITTDNDELAEVLKSIKNYGSAVKYVNDYKGLNSRLDEIQAAVLRVKLPRLDDDNQHRRKIAQYYCENITNPNIVLPLVGNSVLYSSSYNHVWHLFVIRHQERDKLQHYLAENDIQTLIHYPIPPHKQIAYKEWNSLSYKLTETVAQECLSLPISQVMTDEEVESVTRFLNNY